MANLIQFLTEPWSQDFMQRAFLVSIAAALACAVTGTFVVLRGMAFIGDAIAHSVFPGVALSYVLGFNLALGGAIAGVVMAVLMASASRSRRLKEDAAIGVFFAFAFALGIVIVSTQKSYTGDLASFLFGQILGISDQDVMTVLGIGGILIGVTLAFRKELTAVVLDRETAAALGLRVAIWDVVLYVLVAVAIVISLQAVGNILVLALLITPAAAARMLTDRLGTMMALAALFGSVSAVAGLYVSYYYNLASGGLIVLFVTGVFVLCWGIRSVSSRRKSRRVQPEAAIDIREGTILQSY